MRAGLGILLLWVGSSIGSIGETLSSSDPSGESMEQNVLHAAPGASPPAATIDDVAWIAGSWSGEALGGITEEVWSQPRAGAMMGMFRLIKEERVVFYEILSIVEEAGSLVLRLKHFGPDLAGWEEKEAAASFPLVKIGDGQAYFDGLTFRRTEDRLDIFVVQRSKDGEESELRFHYIEQKE